jgi:4-hydroxy-3-polyprenylbenzoate decarboxylase
VVHVESVMHRNQPILTVAHPAKPKNDSSYSECTFRSATMWDEMEKAGVTGIQNVWCHEVGGARLFNVISIKQQFAGHSRQAGMIASQCRSGAYIGRYTVVVDEDIDPSNLGEVIWAISTRTNPDRAIEIIRWTRSSSADPAVSPDLKEEDAHSTAFYTSKAIIDACWPYEWRKRAYPIAQISDSLRTEVIAKFSDTLKSVIR